MNSLLMRWYGSLCGITPREMHTSIQLIRVRGDIDAAVVPEESDNQPIQCGLPGFTLPDEEKSDKINALMLNC